MTSNQKVRLREKQHKHLFEPIAINPSHSKKTCLEPVPNPPSKLARPTIVAPITSRPNEKPSSTNNISYHKTRKPFTVLENISEESFECLNSSHPRPKLTYVLSWEKISKLLSCILFFTEKEPLVWNMGVLFSVTQRIPVEVDEDPSQSFMARLLYDTPNTTIVCILYMQDYTTFETTEMVGHLILFRL